MKDDLLTKREAFAMAAMQSYLSIEHLQHEGEDDSVFHKRIASVSIGAADELLKQLAEKPQEMGSIKCQKGIFKKYVEEKQAYQKTI